eukprot:GEMP01006595.1.p1 GENE.GEMP01006595.1~~GEMP01006595.1.p1  ORF type:complete len:430 (+),score=99.97 GEMP01006595.1:260-1549(+)
MMVMRPPVVFDYSSFCASSLATWRLCCKVHVEETGASFSAQLSREKLEKTQFPWGASTYVFGLNGEYFSVDSLEPHCGIPIGTLPTLSYWFTSSHPQYRFSSIKIHQFDSSKATKNHKTLAFKQTGEGIIFVAALGDYKDGELHVKKDDSEDWRSIPLSTRWEKFESENFQQVTWPTRGIMYIVTVWCEKCSHWINLSPGARRYLVEKGIPGPKYTEEALEPEWRDDRRPEPGARRRFLSAEELSRPEVREALSVIGLDASQSICIRDVRRRFHECILLVHPDRAEIRARARSRDRGFSSSSAEHVGEFSPVSVNGRRSNVNDPSCGSSSDGSPKSPFLLEDTTPRRRRIAPEYLLEMDERDELSPSPSAKQYNKLFSDDSLACDLIKAKRVLYDVLRNPTHGSMRCTPPAREALPVPLLEDGLGTNNE